MTYKIIILFKLQKQHINILWNKYYFKSIPKILAILRVFIFINFLNFKLKNSCRIYEFNFLFLNSLKINITVYFDWTSLLFISLVLLISRIVLFYSVSYIHRDAHIIRFFILVVLFVLRIILLVCSLNIIRILLGWDGLGISSYLLVVYYQNEKSNRAGIITALSNRLGDVSILIIIGSIGSLGSWNFIHLIKFYEILTLLIVLAALTKRAQIPFSSWLPAAMAAPTPVSALVHSSTLVTAGVYILIRFEPAINTSLKSGLFFISCVTILIARISANLNFDLKKIIALSTLSQLGIIIRIIRIGFALIAFFHLLTHAIFKALLFICAGKIIHNTGNSQDIRFIGNITKSLPVSSFILSLSSLALIGFPFLAGFYSKDLLIEQTLIFSNSYWVNLIFFISTGLSASYSIRLLFHTSLKERFTQKFLRIEDKDVIILAPIAILRGVAIFLGSFLRWILFKTPGLINISIENKYIALRVTLLGLFIGIYIRLRKSYLISSSIIKMISLIWFLPTLSTNLLNKIVMQTRDKFLVTLDKTWLEKTRAQGLYSVLIVFSSSRFFIQINKFKRFLLIFFILILYILCLYSLFKIWWWRHRDIYYCEQMRLTGSLIFINRIIFLLSTSPQVLILVLLFQTIIFSILIYICRLKIWFSYIIFLVIVGGLLILFLYLSRLISNKNIILFSNKKIIIFLRFPIVYFIFNFFFDNFKLDSVNFITERIFKLVCSLNLGLYLFLVVYLLFALFIVITILKKSSSPLRLLVFFNNEQWYSSRVSFYMKVLS